MFIFLMLGFILLFSFRISYAQENDTMDGIDVSEWQGDIDFSAVLNSGIEVAYIRSSVGEDYKDPFFERNYQGFKNAGIKVGFYHYVTATTVEEAIREAEYFVSVTENKSPDACLAMDYEYFYGLSDEAVNEISKAFLETVEEKSGRNACVYSDAYNAKNTFSGLTEYPLWIADYYRSEPYSTGQWETWAGFQYTDKGRVPGISGNVDMDYFKSGILDVNTASIPPQFRPAPPTRRYINYTVKSGDTLWGISRKFDTSIAKIAAINELSDANLIFPGQVLKIDAGIITDDGFLSYRVKQGDTLSAIAQKFNTTVKYLAEINNIENPNLIYAGQILKI